MVTMIDEIFDRSYQDGRTQLNDGIVRTFARAANAFGDSFKVLHRIEWSAPWKVTEKTRQCN
jgi:hypothetical protein